MFAAVFAGTAVTLTRPPYEYVTNAVAATHCDNTISVPPLPGMSFTANAEPDAALPAASSELQLTMRLNGFVQPERSVSNPGFASRLGAAITTPGSAIDNAAPIVTATRLR